MPAIGRERTDRLFALVIARAAVHQPPNSQPNRRRYQRGRENDFKPEAGVAPYVRHTVTQAGNQRCKHGNGDAKQRRESATPSTPAGTSTLVAAIAHQGSLHDPAVSAIGRKRNVRLWWKADIGCDSCST